MSCVTEKRQHVAQLFVRAPECINSTASSATDILIQFPMHFKIQKATREAQSASRSCSDDSLTVGIQRKHEKKEGSTVNQEQRI